MEWVQVELQVVEVDLVGRPEVLAQLKEEMLLSIEQI